MAKYLKLTIAKVDGPVFDGEVVSVTLPGTEGEMTIMADHEPLVSALKAGTVTVRPAKGDTTSYDLENGTVEVRDNHATVLI
ncbi:MAG: synthase epsilon chain [Candidatus Parcubacteria bacterium]|jgi:F-type H+-transporting ATPase subunit epsilon